MPHPAAARPAFRRPASGPGNGTPANSYRQLTEGRLLGHSRALLAVRVLHAEGWSTEDLRRSLSGLVRKIPRRLGEVPARPLGEAAAAAGDRRAGPRRRRRLRRRRPGPACGSAVSPRPRSGWTAGPTCGSRRPAGWCRGLLALPAAATTVAARPHGPRIRTARRATTAVDLTVRLAAPDAAALNVAAQALRKLLAAEHAHARRLDGEHLDGFAATLPLGGAARADVPGRPADGVLPAGRLDGLELPIGAAGLMVGRNRNGEPVVARLFRPEQTRALLVGGVRCAQLLALRAMALGARVVVQTARPQAWEPFVRGAAVPGESIAVVPPGRAIEIPPGSALHPLLVVVDVGPVGADTRPGAGLAGHPGGTRRVQPGRRRRRLARRPAGAAAAAARTRRTWSAPRSDSARRRSG